MSENGWDEWQRHVLAELDRLSVSNEKLSKCITNLATEVAVLKIKSGLLGAISGGLTALATFFISRR
jgi:hypothetical protein